MRALGWSVVAASVAWGLASGEAHADPQWHVGVTVGGGVRDLRDEPRGLFHLGATGDVLFLRKSPRSVGLVPYLQLQTASFQSFEFGGGASVLLPVGGPVFILSAGPHARVAHGTVDPGVTGRLFFGSRSFNYHGSYSYALGGFVETRYGVSGRQAEVLGGIEIDTRLLAVPVLFLINAFR